jgi:hypothetical protein
MLCRLACTVNLEPNFQISVVSKILEAADRIQAHDMKKHALNIIVQHYSKVQLLLLGVFFLLQHSFITQVGNLPQIRSLSRELLLDILDALAQDMSLKETRYLSDISSIVDDSYSTHLYH